MATDIEELKDKKPMKLADLKPKEQVRHLLAQNRAAIAQAMPRHMNAERLMRVAQTAVTTTPALLECYIPTLLGGIIQCSQMGLEPNTVLGHAYLVPFFNTKKNRKDVQVIIGYKGLIDLARRSGQIISIAAHAVRENDDFEYEYGLNEKLRHVPAEGERGDIQYFYAVAHMKDGGHAFEVMTRAQVEAIRDGGNKNPVWRGYFEEMGRKSAIRRLAKYLPLSVEFATSVAQDGKIAPVLEDDGALVGEFTHIPEEDAHDGAQNPDSQAGGAGTQEQQPKRRGRPPANAGGSPAGGPGAPQGENNQAAQSAGGHGPITLPECMAAVKRGEYDEALDLARSLTDIDRQAVKAEIERHKAANAPHSRSME